ncbi:hypothetical protein AR687_17090 [Flavobacteriaceae bacterium CRH]|nr:hypothetical protein AR687_17090 [Flavobacteriaceae bacterium CRH]
MCFSQSYFNFGDLNFKKNRKTVDISKEIFVNTFNTKYDSTDYFRKRKIISIDAETNCNDSVYRVYKNVTYINGFNKTIKIKYASIVDCKQAFEKLLSELKIVSSGELYSYVVAGAYLYTNREYLYIISLNAFKNQNLFDKCRNFLISKKLDRIVEINGKLIVLK